MDSILTHECREWLTIYGLSAYLNKKPQAAWKYAQRIGLDTRLVDAARGVEVAVLPVPEGYYRGRMAT